MTTQILRGQNPADLRRLNPPVTNFANNIATATNIGGFNCPQFSPADLNNDGKLDLFVFDRIGNVSRTLVRDPISGKYLFDPNLLAGFPELNDWALLRDFDGDGVADLFTYNDGAIGGIRVFKGKFVNNHLAFDRVNFAFNGNILSYPFNGTRFNLYVNNVDIPAIEDVDGDGDLDILSFEVGGGHVYFYKNMSVEHGFRRDSLPFEIADDCWGKFLDTSFNPFVKLGTSMTCAQNLRNGGGNVTATTRHPGASIATFDSNGDGKLDAVLGSVSFSNLSLLTNANTSASAWMSAQDNNFPSNTEGVNLPIFPAAYFADVDADGKRDVLVTPSSTNFIENYNVVWYYKNVGTAAIPTFQLQQKNFIVGDMMDFGSGANPTFVDANGDGLQDLVVGNGSYFVPNNGRDSRLVLFRNVGSLSIPKFQMIDSNWLNFKALTTIDNNNFSPAFGDLDGDGDLDLIVGEDSGTLFFVENKSNSSSILTMATPISNWKNIQGNAAAKPQIIDLDHDGLPDIVVGTRNGVLRFYKNIGTRTSPNFDATPTNAQLGKIDVRELGSPTGFAAPVFIDFQGKWKLFCGSESGKLWVYDSIDNNLNGTFHLVASDYGKLREGARMTPSIARLTDKNKLQMVIGNLRGGFGFFDMSYNADGTTPTQSIDNQYFATVFPNPTEGILNLLLNETGEFQVKIMNTLGQILKFEKIDTPQYSTDISAFGSGFFIVEIRSASGGRQVLKVFKN